MSSLEKNWEKNQKRNELIQRAKEEVAFLRNPGHTDEDLLDIRASLQELKKILEEGITLAEIGTNEEEMKIFQGLGR